MSNDYQTTNSEIETFSANLIIAGIDVTQYDQNDLRYLLKVAKLCSKEVGVPLGIAVGAATSGVGSVTLPFVGAVPGYIAGFLAGVVGGTVSCTISRGAVKRYLDGVLGNSSNDEKNFLKNRPQDLY